MEKAEDSQWVCFTKSRARGSHGHPSGSLRNPVPRYLQQPENQSQTRPETGSCQAICQTPSQPPRTAVVSGSPMECLANGSVPPFLWQVPVPRDPTKPSSFMASWNLAIATRPRPVGVTKLPFSGSEFLPTPKPFLGV